MGCKKKSGNEESQVANGEETAKHTGCEERSNLFGDCSFQSFSKGSKLCNENKRADARKHQKAELDVYD